MNRGIVRELRRLAAEAERSSKVEEDDWLSGQLAGQAEAFERAAQMIASEDSVCPPSLSYLAENQDAPTQ